MFAYLFLWTICLVHLMKGQNYTEKQTRHRFAQLNLGLDVQSSIGGQTRYLKENGPVQTMDLNSPVSPRVLIGGTHFWGHADFVIAIPLYKPIYQADNQEITATRRVETVLKYYPLRIENNKLRPFIGASITPFVFQHTNKNLTFPNGPKKYQSGFPLVAGLTWNRKSHLLELGATWNYNHRFGYYVARDRVETISSPPLFINLSYRFMLETTASAETDWESGKTEEITRILAENGGLNGWYLGVGVSSAFWLKTSSYNTKVRPFVSKNEVAILPDFTLGYYLHKQDLNVAFAYRGYSSLSDTYGVEQKFGRKSILLEATKCLFDYHGFVPFIGPAISLERLSFSESFEGTETLDVSEDKFGYGLTFGWDIRPNRIQTWILRTNLRWFPNLNLELQSEFNANFENLEFNFIQFIVFPGRMM